jgi:hypothetical protein
MLVPIEGLIDGVVRTLLESVLPDVSTRFARGQLYAAVDVLRNVRDRVDVKAALLDGEIGSATAALERVSASLGARGAGIAEALATAPAAAAERVVALRAALVDALELIDGLSPDEATPARAAIFEHLASQALRDLVVLKPSLLTEISKG